MTGSWYLQTNDGILPVGSRIGAVFFNLCYEDEIVTLFLGWGNYLGIDWSNNGANHAKLDNGLEINDSQICMVMAENQMKEYLKGGEKKTRIVDGTKEFKEMLNDPDYFHRIHSHLDRYREEEKTTESLP